MELHHNFARSEYLDRFFHRGWLALSPTEAHQR